MWQTLTTNETRARHICDEVSQHMWRDEFQSGNSCQSYCYGGRELLFYESFLLILWRENLIVIR